MNFPFYIAKRYLISKKSHNVINIISWISVLGITIGTAALIIVLSAFNGLQFLVEDLYASFDPDLKITLVEGKTFDASSFPKDKILAIDEVAYYNQALEEVALIKYDDKQTVATIKGVDPAFYQMTGLDTLLISGNLSTKENGLLLGWGVSDKLSLYVTEGIPNQTQIIIPKRGTKKGLTPDSEFHRKFANTTGVFSVNPDFDTKYALTDLRFVQKLLKHKNQISSVELGLDKDANWDEIKAKVQGVVGDKYEVKTRYELNELIFKTNKTEKWITSLILTFILIIASFNIIGSLTMLIIDKKKDIWILKTMGANNEVIRKIFFSEGMLINLLGAIIGMILGAFVCWLQAEFGLLKLQGGVVDAYPIKLMAIDFLYVSGIVLVIGLLASWYPVRILTKRHL
ncbi:MAG: FtsX-like permease family protein [Vicingaceae bacterium]|nr:FtsX-like permease family protein [Vicingaceae bacterium]